MGGGEDVKLREDQQGAETVSLRYVRVFGFLVALMVIPIDERSKGGRKLSRKNVDQNVQEEAKIAAIDPATSFLEMRTWMDKTSTTFFGHESSKIAPLLEPFAAVLQREIRAVGLHYYPPPLTMGGGENVNIREDRQGPEMGLRVFNGKEKFPSGNPLGTLLALGITLGAIHFVAVLVIFSLLFLPLSRSFLLMRCTCSSLQLFKIYLNDTEHGSVTLILN
ncbi:hypothetical protein SAY87_017059 [Trapa incisa]|uniref:Uncharacterized protein n=1 Tax=Trapa incisa TaxID=236973 RepID=A0AAN7LDG0_9MYRT|nr:hypothetical protein SAY87_017059 [Trapa incisa]